MPISEIRKEGPSYVTTLLIAGAVGLLMCATAVAQRQVQVSDLELLATKGGAVDLSADGQWLAVEVGGHIHIIDTSDPNLREDIGEGIAPSWSPAGADLAFYSTRSGDRQLWRWSVSDSNPRQITRLAGGIDPDPTTRIAGYVSDAFGYSWSPKGQYIVFPSRIAVSEANPADTNPGQQVSADGVHPLVLNSTTPLEALNFGSGNLSLSLKIPEVRSGKSIRYRLGNHNERLFNQLLVVEVLSGDIEQLTHCNCTSFNPSWSPDGLSVALSRVYGAILNTTITSGEIVIIDVRSGIEDVIVSDRSIKYHTRWSPDGRAIAYLAKSNLYAWPELHVTTVELGNRTSLSIPFDRFVARFEWSRLADGFIVQYRDGVSWRLGLLRQAQSAIQEITARGSLPYAVSSFAQSGDGRLVWRQVDPKTLSTVQYASHPETSARSLVQLNTEFDQLTLGRAQVISWTNRRGDHREGTLMFPPDYDAKRAYPMIVDVYPGLGGADWSKPMHGNFALAAKGYLVFRASPRSPLGWMNPWKSRESSALAIGSQGWELTFDDVMSGVDMLVDLGIVDSERLCLHGHSNGGGVVAELITRTERFRCAVIIAPASTNWLRLAMMAHVTNAVSKAAGTGSLEESLEEYVALSPVYRLNTVNTPVLIAVGDSDPDFLQNAIEVYGRLRVLDKDVTLLRYANQGHVFSGEALVDFWDREFAFLESHIGDDDAEEP